MLNQDNFKVLILVEDDNLGNDLILRIRTGLIEIPFSIGRVETLSKLIEEVKKNDTQLVICSERFPGGNDERLQLEIQQHTAETQLLILREDLDENKELLVEKIGVEYYSLPIRSWKEFIGKIKEKMPEHLKMKFGIHTAPVKKIEHLKVYSANLVKAEKALLESKNFSISSVSRALIQVPSSYLISVQAGESENTNGFIKNEKDRIETHGEQKTEIGKSSNQVGTSSQSVSEGLKLKGIRVDIMLVPVFATATFLVKKNVEDDSLLSMGNLLGVSTLVVVLGMVFSMITENLLKVSEKRKQNS